MNPSRPRISALLPTYNNAAYIHYALESVKWADEILVVDSFSTDGTLDICRKYGARIVQHEYINSAVQKNWAIPQCTHGWVLQIDSDEELEAGAEDEIRARITSAPEDLHAFAFRRKNFIFCEWVHVGDLYPDLQPRVFRRDVAQFEDKQVHAHVRVPGRTMILEHHLLHNGMVTIGKQLSNIDRYSRYQAIEYHARGKRFHWIQLVLRPIALFNYYYLWKRDFTAGYRGLFVAAIKATFDFWSHAKLWELKYRDSHIANAPTPLHPSAHL